MRNRAGDYPRRYLPINKQFELAKARIKARYSFKADYAVEYFEAAVAQDVQRSKEASLYGLALAYMRAEKIEKAKDIMDELIAKDRGNLFYLDAMTDIYISQGEPLKAVEMLRPTLRITLEIKYWH